MTLPEMKGNLIRFKVIFDFLPRPVISRFIIKAHKDIVEPFMWRSGVLLQSRNGFCRVEVKVDYEDRVITINLTGENTYDYKGECAKIKVSKYVYDPKNDEAGDSIKST